MAQRGLNTNPFEENRKGRDALFAGVEADAEILEIPIGSIDPDPDQVRRSLRDESFRNEDEGGKREEDLRALSESIKAFGLAQPVHVFKNGERYALLFGERRLEATKAAGLSSICAVVHRTRPENVTERQLAENLHRKDLTDTEIFEALRRILNSRPDLKRGDLGRILGKSPQWVSRFMLLEEPENRRLVEEGIVSGAAVLSHFLSLPKDGRAGLLDRKLRQGGGAITYSDIAEIRRSPGPENSNIGNVQGPVKRKSGFEDGGEESRGSVPGGSPIPKNSNIGIFQSGESDEDRETGPGEKEKTQDRKKSSPLPSRSPVGLVELALVTISASSYERLQALRQEWECESESRVIDRLLQEGGPFRQSDA